MRASQADSVVSTSTTAPLQVSNSLQGGGVLPCTAAQLLTSAAGAACTQVPELLFGKFYYADGSTYEGQYKLLGLVPAADAVPAKKGLKKKEDEAPAQPAEPPKPLRHGAGQASQLSCLAHHNGLMLGCLESGSVLHPQHAGTAVAAVAAVVVCAGLPGPTSTVGPDNLTAGLIHVS